MGAGQPAIGVMDASVLINFLKIDRMDLIAGHSHDFVITDHVTVEITSRYPDQQQLLASAIEVGAVAQVSITNPRKIAFFETLARPGRLGVGECSAIAMAVCRHYMLAIDDRRAVAEARRASHGLTVLNTQDLMTSMIREDLLDITEADGIMNEWDWRHRFALKIRSFREVV